jgi:hypothetical protein
MEVDSYHYSYLMKKFLLGLGVFVVAFAILSVSILESSSISYSFKSPLPSPQDKDANISEINYVLPNAGSVLPDSPLWNLKALRDRVWYLITPSPLKRAELALLFSDKRLAAAKTLIENKKINIAISTLTKGEKYLEIAVSEENIAKSQGYDTTGFLNKLALASLKHREIIDNLLPLIPEDGKPLVIKTENYSKDAYKAARDGLNSKGILPPKDPFDGD